MKIFITCETLSERTAQSTQVVEMTTNFGKLGHQVLIFCPSSRKYREAAVAPHYQYEKDLVDRIASTEDDLRRIKPLLSHLQKIPNQDPSAIVSLNSQSKSLPFPSFKPPRHPQ